MKSIKEELKDLYKEAKEAGDYYMALKILDRIYKIDQEK